MPLLILLLLVGLFSKTEVSITGSLIGVEREESKIYWSNNNETILLSFDSYVKEFYPIQCIDYKELRELIIPNPEIKELSYKLTSNSISEFEVVYNLHQFVYNNISYETDVLEIEVNNSFDIEEILKQKEEYYSGGEGFIGIQKIDDLHSSKHLYENLSGRKFVVLNAEQILSQKKGDCSGKALLLQSLLETKGINSYIVDTIKHRYLFVEIAGVWTPIDPSASDMFFIYKLQVKNSRLLQEFYFIERNAQVFMFNSTTTLFNKNWCAIQ